MADKLYHYCVLSNAGTYKSGIILWKGSIAVDTFYESICDSISDSFVQDFVIISLTYVGEAE